jgi:hypothetical protein
MASLFLALLLFPEVQEQAQAELDSVISRDRLPTYDDKPRLPYIEAMSKELLRWYIVTPLGMGSPLSSTAPSRWTNVIGGVPHALSEDDIYKGHFLPKGL